MHCSLCPKVFCDPHLHGAGTKLMSYWGMMTLC
jgi:hypothetical protein